MPRALCSSSTVSVSPNNHRCSEKVRGTVRREGRAVSADEPTSQNTRHEPAYELQIGPPWRKGARLLVLVIVAAVVLVEEKRLTLLLLLLLVLLSLLLSSGAKITKNRTTTEIHADQHPNVAWSTREKK